MEKDKIVYEVPNTHMAIYIDAETGERIKNFDIYNFSGTLICIDIRVQFSNRVEVLLEKEEFKCSIQSYKNGLAHKTDGPARRRYFVLPNRLLTRYTYEFVIKGIPALHGVFSRSIANKFIMPPIHKEKTPPGSLIRLNGVRYQEDWDTVLVLEEKEIGSLSVRLLKLLWRNRTFYGVVSSSETDELKVFEEDNILLHNLINKKIVYSFNNKTNYFGISHFEC